MIAHPFKIVANPTRMPPWGLRFWPTLAPRHSDDIDIYPEHRPSGCRGADISACNAKIIRNAIAVVRPRVIVEIGIARGRLEHTATSIFLAGKHPEALYIGIDTRDCSHLHDPAKGVHILRGDSADTRPLLALLHALDRPEIDLLFIDGLHSVNQVVADWHYARLLAEGGRVLLHDTNYHPGPIALLAALNTEQWHVIHWCDNSSDWGIAQVWRR